MALPEPKTVRHNAQSLGVILDSHPIATSLRESPSEIECQECQKRRPPSVLPGLCRICFRRIELEKMPEEQREMRVVEIVRKRYQAARLDHLSVALKEQLEKLNDTDSLYMWGTPGVGKTYAMAALARTFIESGFNVRRENWEKLCLRIRDTFKPQARETELSIIEPYLACDKLFIEDVGTTVSVGRQESDFSLRVFLLILDVRSEDCLPTYITGNKSVVEIGRSFDARIASRLRQGTIIHKTGDDKRKQKQ